MAILRPMFRGGLDPLFGRGCVNGDRGVDVGKPAGLPLP
jgi:hypothetical protein